MPDPSTTARESILRILREVGRPLSPREVADKLEPAFSYQTIRQEMAAMAREDLLEKPNRSVYIVAGAAPALPAGVQEELERLRAENEQLRAQLQQKERPTPAQETGPGDEEERRRLSYEGLLKAGASPDTSGRRISLPEPVMLALLRGVRLKVMGEATITLNILAEGPDEHVVRDLLEILGPNPGKDSEKAER